jgi:glycosyltransferase involved in cell wall biosynthesis
MKLALVHDWLINLGGAERVLIELHKIFPEAPIYTLFYNKKFKSKYLINAEIRTSYLQKIPLITRHYKFMALFIPSVIESFDLSDFDVVLSSSVFFSKGLVLKPKTKHICYCYSPARQLWDLHSSYYPIHKKTENKITIFTSKLAQHFLRIWDRQAADRVDEFIAISKTVQSRIKKYYRKDAKIIYPPIPNLPQGDHKRPIEKEYYLIVSRLFPYKNINIAINAFNKLGFNLVIIGDGPEYKKLKSQIINHKQIQMLGQKSDEVIATFYRHSKAFIMPQEEDFGLTALEAMSFGKPVLALRKGGALETIKESITGEFFDDPIPEALSDGLRRLNENYKKYRPELIQHYAKQFSSENFKKNILDLI